MVVAVGDAGQVAFGVVGVLRQIVGRVGDRGQAIGVVISVDGRLVVLVGGRGATPACVVSEAGRGVVGIGNAGQPAHGVVGERRRMRAAVDRIDHAGPIAARVIAVAGPVKANDWDDEDSDCRLRKTGAH